MNAPRSRGVLWTIPAVYLVFLTAEFAAVTHVTLTLTAQGRSALAVGVFVAALWLGILGASLLSYRLVARAGHARVFVGGTVLAALAAASFALHADYIAWSAGAALLGLGGGLVWVAGESWLTETAPAAQRGFFVGLFEAAVGLGLMAGPAMVPLTRALGWPTLVFSAALMALALAISAVLLRWTQPAADDGAVPAAGSAGAGAAAASARERAAAQRAALAALLPPLVGISAISGLMESGVSALFPPISMRVGFSLEAAAWLGTVVGAGSALLQPPAGVLADRLGTRGVTLACWCVVLVATLLLLAGATHPQAVLWLVGFVLGGVGGAVYTLLIVELGHRLIGSALVKAMATLVASYSVGTTLGPLIGGYTFDRAGLVGTATLLALLSSAGLVMTWFALRPAPSAPGGNGAPQAGLERRP